MQLCVRGLSTHVLDCESDESIAQIKDRIAALEKVQSSEVILFAEGVPISDDSSVCQFENIDIELTVGLPGGKVHGSLARAGKVKAQTPKVEKQEKKKKKKTGRAKKRMQYNKRFSNEVTTNGPRRGPNSNAGRQ